MGTIIKGSYEVMKQRIENSTWKNILNDVKGQMTDVSFRTWFLPLTPIEMDPDAGTFIVASSDKMRINLLTLHFCFLPAIHLLIYGSGHPLNLMLLIHLNRNSF